MIEPCDLDTATPDGLREFASVYRKLAQMADLRATAHELRSSGMIQSACDIETGIERLYTSLPESVKW